MRYSRSDAPTRKVPVEVIVNGYPVAKQEIEADGSQKRSLYFCRVLLAPRNYGDEIET